MTKESTNEKLANDANNAVMQSANIDRLRLILNKQLLLTLYTYILIPIYINLESDRRCEMSQMNSG